MFSLHLNSKARHLFVSILAKDIADLFYIDNDFDEEDLYGYTRESKLPLYQTNTEPNV